MYPTRFPRRQSTSWGVASVRSAHAREGNTFTVSSSFVVEGGRCWRPGYATPEGLEPDAERALKRHAEHTARSASADGKARRAA
jgi:hypothetical protein